MSTIAAPPVSGTVTVIVGFTAHAMPEYHPVRDGYRKGADQVEIMFRIDTAGIEHLTPTEIGEAVFEVTAQPIPDHPHPVTNRVYEALNGLTVGGPVPVARPLAVGDTLTVIGSHGYHEAIEVSEFGWMPLGADDCPVPAYR